MRSGGVEDLYRPIGEELAKITEVWSQLQKNTEAFAAYQALISTSTAEERIAALQKAKAEALAAREALTSISSTIEARRRVWEELGRAWGKLSAEDQLILRMRFERDLPVADVARELHLEQKPLHRRIERLKKELQAALERGGIGRDHVAEVIGKSAEQPAGSQNARTKAEATSMTTTSTSGGRDIQWAVDSALGFPELTEAMMPHSVPTPAIVLQARRNSEARAALMQEYGVLTDGQIAEINESAAENRAMLASDWKQDGKIFSVAHRGTTYYPAFQFAPTGRPRPVVARVLEALGGDDGWETALWFTAANGYLEGARPVDLLETDPEAVVEAAKKDAEVPS